MAEDQNVDTLDAPEGKEGEEKKRGEQKVTIEDVGPARKCLTIEVPAERIQEAVGKSYDELKDEAVIPGFRRGRAPMRLIEKRFGSAVRGDVKGQLIAECYEQAVEDEKLKVIGSPEMKDAEELELPDEGPLTFKVEVEVAPEFELPALEGIAVEKPIAEVRDEDVEEELEGMTKRYGKLDRIDDGKAEEGDYLEVDVWLLAGENTELPANPRVPTEDEEEAETENPVIAHYADTYTIVHGKDKDYKGHVVGILVPDLGKQTKGKTIGDNVVISQTGPSGHENEKIKDKPITIHLRINGIQRPAPASIDEILEQTGIESQDELRKEIRASLEANRDRNQKVSMREQVCDYLLDKVEFELPEGLSSRQTARLLQRQAMELAYRGMGEQEIEQMLAEMRSSSEEEARKQLKLFFVLEKAAEALDVDVSDGEVNSRIVSQAIQQGRRPEKMRQEMMRSGQLEQLYISIREQKTLDAIIEKADVTEKELPEDDEDAAKEETSKKKSSKKKSKKKAAKKEE